MKSVGDVTTHTANLLLINRGGTLAAINNPVNEVDYAYDARHESNL